MKDAEHEKNVTFEHDLVDYIWHIPVPLDKSGWKYFLTKFPKFKPTLKKFEETLDRLEKEGLIAEQKGKYVCTEKGNQYRRKPYPL